MFLHILIYLDFSLNLSHVCISYTNLYKQTMERRYTTVHFHAEINYTFIAHCHF